MNKPKIIYYDNGHKEHEIYLNNKGFCYRKDGPAVIEWYVNGQKHYEKYYNYKGEYHREDGPAIIYYNNDKIIKEEYFINGEKLDKFKIRKLKLRNLNLL